MITSHFAATLRDLESYFNCRLEPDSNNSCLIQFKSGLQIQLEPLGSDDLLIGIKLGFVPASAYQERVFKAALRSNDQGPLSQGSVGWSKKSGQLIIFMTIDLRYNNSEKIKEMLTPFMTRAKMWYEAIQNGNIPVIEEEKSTSPGLFGIR